MSILAQVPQQPWYAHRWPWLLMLGPAIVVAAGSYTGYLAFSNPDPLVVGDYYKRGKAINQDLRRDRVATERAMALNLNYDAQAGQLVGAARSGGTAYGETLMLGLSHATLPHKDLQFVLVPDAQGSFRLALPMLERSRWHVVVEGGKGDWRLEGQWNWPAQRAIEIKADVPL
jgi:hypothetical protein